MLASVVLLHIVAYCIMREVYEVLAQQFRLFDLTSQQVANVASPVLLPQLLDILPTCGKEKCQKLG